MKGCPRFGFGTWVLGFVGHSAQPDREQITAVIEFAARSLDEVPSASTR
jgi:hypothetical protein